MNSEGHLLSEGILLANDGPTLTKKELKPFDISDLFVVILLFTRNREQFDLDLFLLITSLIIVQDFLRLFLCSSIAL